MLACTPNAISIILLFQLDYPPQSPLNPCTSFFHLPENKGMTVTVQELGLWGQKEKKGKKEKQTKPPTKKDKINTTGENRVHMHAGISTFITSDKLSHH